MLSEIGAQVRHLKQMLGELEEAGSSEGSIRDRGLTVVALQIAVRKAIPGKWAQEIQGAQNGRQVGGPARKVLQMQPQGV